MAIDDAHIQSEIRLATANPGTVRHPDRKSELARQPKYAGDMVAMLMSNENPRQIRWRSAKAEQPSLGFP